MVADVSRPEGAAGFVRDARDALGGVDILVANAGGPPAGDFEHTTVDQYREAFELNCASSIALIRPWIWSRSIGVMNVLCSSRLTSAVILSACRSACRAALDLR